MAKCAGCNKYLINGECLTGWCKGNGRPVNFEGLEFMGAAESLAAVDTMVLAAGIAKARVDKRKRLEAQAHTT